MNPLTLPCLEMQVEADNRTKTVIFNMLNKGYTVA